MKKRSSFSFRPPILSGSLRPDQPQLYISSPEEMGVQAESLKWLRLIWALVLLSVVLFGMQARTQEVTAGITGTVTDHRGAAVVDVLVTATDTQRGTSFSTRSNADGIYYLQRIPVGTYRLRAESEAFSTAILPPFTLILNQIARLDFQMELGSIKEVVEVSAQAPLLQTQSTEVSTIIDAETNVALPLASRNYVQLALLAPGAVTPNREAIATANRIDRAGQPYINGNREQANNFLLDGMDNNQVSDNLVAYSPSPDAIQEFNLITQNASAEFGNFQGGIISVSIKSGTNQFHGDLWEFFRNDKLNANNFFNNFFQLPRPALRWNMFGGTVGGPILKKKLFFFADYQGQRFDVYSNNAFSALTGPERAGDFGQLCTDSNFTGRTYSFNSSGICVDSNNNPASTQILDPFTQTPIPNNNLAQYISKGTDPQLTAYYNSGAGKVFQNLVNTKYYPSVASLTSASIINNYSFSTRSPLNVDQGDFKVDYNLSEKDHFSGRYSREEQVNNPVNSLLLVPVNLGTAIMSNGVLDWTHTFNTRLVSDFRFGVNWVQLLSNRSATPGIGDLGVAIGIANGNSGGEGLPGISIGPSSGVGGPGGIVDWSNTVIQVGDTVDITRGRHVFHVGFQFLRERLDDALANGPMGFYTMTGTYTGSADSDFYLGMVNFEGQYFSTTGSSSPEVWGQRSTVFGAFVQDNWRLTSNLTLNLGLRYQVHTPWTEVEGRQVNYGIYSGQPYYPAGSHLPASITFPGLQPEPNSNKALYNGYYGIGAWQPRLGIAYTPGFLHGKTVLRAAVTASDYLEGTGNNLRLTVNIPFSARLQLTNVIPPGIPGYNPAQLQIADGIPSPTTGDPFSGAVVNVWAPDVRPAMTQQWNLAVQQQFSSDTTLQVAYVGQRGTHLMVPLNMLQGDLQSGGTVLPSPYLAGNPGLLAKGVTALGTFSIGEMSYNALQVVLQKRMGQGLEGQISYSYSHCLTNSSGYYGDGAQAVPQYYWQNTFNPKAEWGSCYYDLTHNLTAFAIYQLPVGKGRSFGKNLNPIINAVVGAWDVSLIYSLHGGFPLTIYGNDYSTTNSYGSRADCNGGTKYARQFIPGVGLQWFSPAPYSNPTVLTFGNCGVGTVRGPGLNRFDIGLQKEFPVHESMRFEFRAEFLNAFNHPTFDAPNTFCGGSSGATCAPGIGVIAGSEGERNIQFAMKFYF